jgi:cyclophilin family peptidyl-prolyl cis-trans isomerase
VPSADKRQRQKENTRAAREAREAALRRRRQRRTALRVGIFVALFALLIVVVTTIGRDDKKKPSAAASTSSSAASTSSTAPRSTTTTIVAKVPASATATITTNFGPIVVELDTKNAPNASAQFIKLAKSGFYNGLTWHRVVKNFVIQGGDPKGDGSGGYGHPIVGEVPKDHYPVGSLAAAKTPTDPPGTFDSQFFIVTGANGATLPNDYARFGKVIAGIENAQKIEALAPTTNNGDGAPTKKATMDKVTISEK